MLHGTAAALGALLLTAVLTGLVRRVALRAGLVDRTGRTYRHGGRRLPPRPLPRLGGVAVVVGTLLVCVATGPAPLSPGLKTLLTAAVVVALLGLLHDLRPLRARPRLAVEAGAAVAVVYGSGLAPGAGALAVVWIVLVTNAFSGLDHSDGAAGAVGVVTALGLALCAAAEGLEGLALVLSVLAAALTGFLIHNWHPARISLGDCGARCTGFLLASGAVLVHVGHPALPSVAALFALAAVATADAVLILLTRLSRRRSGRGAADHAAHRLRRLGLTAQGAAVVLAVVAFAGTLTGLLVHRGTLDPVAVLPLAAVLLLAVGGLLRVPAYGSGPPRTARTRTPGANAARAPRPTVPVSGTRAPVSGTRGRVAAPRSARSARTDLKPSGVRLPLPGRRARGRTEAPRSAADLARG
ncbi:MraY family glycosyltransferase [Streptomyces sp. E11-3]|uniref:MraY family glycosyltransferase n=1 Tax=Streptomyces sp. E11-3 TaxID=3110112 RepID=UPI00398175FD